MQRLPAHVELEKLRKRVAELEAQSAAGATRLPGREELLSVALNASTGPIFLKDLNSRYILANTATAHAFGREGPQDIEGKFDRDLAPPDIAAALVECDKQVFASGRLEVFEETVTDGVHEPRVFLTTKVPWRDSSGKIIGLQAWAEDITERKRVEAALAAAEHNARIMLQGIPDGYFALDADWRITEVNRQAEILLGTNAESLVGKVFWDVLPGVLGSPFEPVYRSAMEERTPGHVVAYYPEHYRYYESSVQPFEAGISIYLRDVTEKRRAEETLRETNTRLELAQRAAGLGIFDWNVMGDVWTVSAEWRQIFGFDEAKAIHHVDWERAIHADDHERVIRSVFRSVRNGTFYEDEYRVVHPDSTVRWVRIAGKSELDAVGNPVRFIGTAMDITQRKEAEAALERQLGLTRGITDTATTALFIIDDQQHCVFLNPAAEKLTGFTLQEMKGKPLHDVVHHTRPDGTPYPIDECPIERAFVGHVPARGEEVYVHRDGHFYEIAFTATPVRLETGLVGTVLEVQDITERKRRDAERRQTEQLLDAVLEALPISIIIADADGGIVRMNAASRKIWGENPPMSESIAHYAEWKGFLPGTDVRIAPDEWPLSRAVLKGETVRDELIEIQRFGDGDRVLLQLSAAPVVNESGAVLGGVVACMDVTERVRAEEAIKASEATLKAVLDSLPVGVVIADAEGRIVRDNAANRDIWGIPPETSDWKQYDQWVAFWPETGQRVQAHEWAMARALLHGEVVKGELIECQPFGTTERRFYLNNAAPVRDAEGNIIAGVAAELDVTEHKRAEEALRNSEEEFRTLANAIPQLCWMAKPDGTIFWYNQRWYEYTGTTPEQLTGDGWHRVHDPETLPTVIEKWDGALRSGEPLDMVFPLRGRDGVCRPFLTRVVPVRDWSGRVVRWFGTHTDISEQKRIEQELRRANQDLEQFAYSASHDLQEPLRNVSIYSQLLQRKYAPTLDDHARTYLNYLVEGSQRMGQLVADLLSYTQAARNDSDGVTPLDANEVLAQVVNDMRSVIESSGATITHDPLPPVMVKPVHMQQLLQNVLSNALKYTKEGESPRIHVSVAPQGTFVEFAVSDNGIGIQQQYQQQIFGIFKRLHGRHGRFPGTGIGLAICQKIVERYGGKIWVESEPEDGSTFRFTLPAAPTEG